MSDNVEQRNSTLVVKLLEPSRELIDDRTRRVVDRTIGVLHWPILSELLAGGSPPVELDEFDDEYVIEADLPGVKRKDVTLELAGSSGTAIRERCAARCGSRRFSNELALPAKTDRNKIDASLTDGVLMVGISKAERRERQQIELTLCPSSQA